MTTRARDDVLEPRWQHLNERSPLSDGGEALGDGAVDAAVALLPNDAVRTSSVGRRLRRLRLAAGLSQADAAVAIEVPIRRVKELEAGATLGYLEGLRLAKAYLLCPPCFRRAFEAAIEREGLEPPILGDV